MFFILLKKKLRKKEKIILSCLAFMNANHDEVHKFVDKVVAFASQVSFSWGVLASITNEGS